MKKLVVLSGAGMSAESGLKTFRDANSLWEGHNVMDVASPEGWNKNPALVLDFYNQRRRQLLSAKPNAGHTALAKMEKDFDVHIITQNVDDLHEKGGSTKVLHLHGELFKARSLNNPDLITDCFDDILPGHKATDGSQLRPHIVWFGEAVPALDEAVSICSQADYFAVIGTSLQVYPAAGLITVVNSQVPMFYIDPNPATIYDKPNRIQLIPTTASKGIGILHKTLISLKAAEKDI